MKRISILGSTGSIGRCALEVIEKHPSLFSVVGLSAGQNIDLLLEQVKKFRPKIVSLQKKEDAQEFERRCTGFSLRITYEQEGAEEVAGFEENSIVVSAITGIKGLRPTLAAARTGGRIALANKESMVVAGPLILETARRNGTQIIPVDSEHSGVFQCLASEKREYVKKVILTASGGPFFRLPADEIKNKSLEEALDHPRWKMGDKVTIDSATLMNKGLELIEARWLFGLQPDQLGILIHPQSIVHSLVEMRDGSVLAQLSPTEMKIPIQYALTYPQREKALIPSLDLSQIQTLEFYEVDANKFPLVSLAIWVLEQGKSLPIVLNAANEVAVETFLNREIGLHEISEIVTEVVQSHHNSAVQDLDDIFDVDLQTRDRTHSMLSQRS
jgi:1-deoxy-D-xylulose-5-phosphate reductoisomerase